MRSGPAVGVIYPDPQVPVISAVNRYRAASPPHRHTADDWEIQYVVSGRMGLEVDGELLDLSAGELALINPVQVHSRLEFDGEVVVLIFRGGYLRDLAPALGCDGTQQLIVAGVPLPARLRLSTARRPAVEALLHRLAAETFDTELGKGALCAGLVSCLLLELARAAAGGVSGEPAVEPAAVATVEGLCRVVEAALDQPWTRAELARRSGYSPSHLAALFRRVTGSSPGDWLRRRRIARACELLADTDDHSAAIAALVGYGSRAQFYRAFRAVTGVTPSQYRQAVRHG